MTTRKVLQAVGGFAVGGLVGFAVGIASGKATRKRLPSSVATEFDKGELTVKVDLARAVSNPAVDLLESVVR